ncbi:MAG: TonB family protein, partial [Rugosibacter sp.]
PALPAPPVAAPIRPHVVQREKPYHAANPAVPSAPTFPASAPARPVADTAPQGAVANVASAPAALISAPLAEAMSAPAESVASLSADGLRRYRLSLAAQARRFKRYPAQALAAGWAGTAEIRLEIGNDGQESATLSRSSGYAVLDRAAQAMIEQSAQRTPVPEALRGKAFSVVLPVLFDINDGG